MSSETAMLGLKKKQPVEAAKPADDEADEPDEAIADVEVDEESSVELSKAEYGAKVGGKKGNVTLLSFDGRFKIQKAVLDQLKHCRGSYRFSRGEHRENTVSRHCIRLTERSLPVSPFVKQTVSPGDCGNYARYALLSRGDGSE